MAIQEVVIEKAPQERDPTLRRAVTIVAVVAAALILYYGHSVFLLLFAGLLVGVLFDGLATYVTKWTRLSRAWSLPIVVFTLIFLFAALVNALAPGIAYQVRVLQFVLPRSIDHLRIVIAQYSWGDAVLRSLPDLNGLAAESSNLAMRVGGAVTATVFTIIKIVLVLVIGIYSAAEPERYRDAFIRLFAPKHHEQIQRTLHFVHDRLWWWLVGMAAAMISLSILAFIGLTILNVPLALTLALLTGLLTFIPNFGPIMSAVPPTLLGLLHGPGRAGTVILMYFIIQFLEAHLVTPLIQRRMIRMPPVLAISAQLTFGFLFGFLGLLLAVPLMAALVATIQSLRSEAPVSPNKT